MAEAKELESKMAEIKNIASKPEAATNFYQFIHIISQILLAIKNGDVIEGGWAAKITTMDGSMAFTASQATELESLVADALPTLELVTGIKPPSRPTQKGGADPKELAGTIMSLASQYLNPDEMSIDRVFSKATAYLDQLDEQNRQLARVLGPVAFTSELERDPRVPNPLIVFGIPPDTIPIPARSILPFTNAILEIMRIAVALSPIELPFIRNMMSISQAMFDVMRGEWKYGIFSLLGVLGNKSLLFGVFLKICRDAWLLIEPGLSKQLRMNMFRAGKSMFVGFWLWAFSTFAPDFIRNPINSALGPFHELVKSVNEQIGNFQTQANQLAAPMGVRMTFPTIPENVIPSFADIQNLQTLVQQPEVYCSTTVRQLLEPMRLIPPLRLVLELLNVPIDPDFQAEACRGINPKDLSGELAKRLRPQIDFVSTEAAEKALDEGIAEGIVKRADDVDEKEDALDKRLNEIADKEGVNGLLGLLKGENGGIEGLVGKGEGGLEKLLEDGSLGDKAKGLLGEGGLDKLLEDGSLGDKAKGLLGEGGLDKLLADGSLGDKAKGLLGEGGLDKLLADGSLGDKAKGLLGDKAKGLLGDKAKGLLGEGGLDKLLADGSLGDKAKGLLGDKAKGLLGEGGLDKLLEKGSLGDKAKGLLGSVSSKKLGFDATKAKGLLDGLSKGDVGDLGSTLKSFGVGRKDAGQGLEGIAKGLGSFLKR